MLASRDWAVIINRVDSQQEIAMVALNEELSGIADRPQRYLGSTAGSRGTDPGARGSMSRNHPRSIPYCSDSHLPDSDFSRHYARNRNYSPSIGRSISQDPLQFINGANTYQFVMSNPVGNVDPAGADVYVYHNWNIHGLLIGHENIVVDTSGGGEYGVSFGLIPGTGLFTGRGEVYLDNGETHLWASDTLSVPPLLNEPFDALVQNYLHSLIGRTGPYTVYRDNCEKFSQSQFSQVEQMYNHFIKDNLNIIHNIMDEQNNMIPGWSTGGAVFTS